MQDAGRSCEPKIYPRAQVDKLTYMCFIFFIEDELAPKQGGGARGTSWVANEGKTRKRPREAEGCGEMFLVTWYYDSELKISTSKFQKWNELCDRSRGQDG